MRPLRSRIAACQSLLLIFARTAAKSGASGFGVSTAKAAGGSATIARPANVISSRNVRPSCKLRSMDHLPNVSTGVGPQAAFGLGQAFGRRKHVAIAILGKGAKAREGKMRTADHHLLGNDTIDQLAPCLNGQRSVLIVNTLPLRMRAEQGRHVGGIVGDHQLVLAGTDVEGRMPWGVAWRLDEPDSRRHFPLMLNEGQVLPAGEDGVDALTQRLARLGKLLHPARLGPPFVFAGAYHQLRLRKDGGVAPLLHQAKDVIGVKVRNQDQTDLTRINAGSLDVGCEPAGRGLPLPTAGARIDHDGAAADL